MRVGIAGCGLIGSRRAEVISRSTQDHLVVVADVNRMRAMECGRRFGCEWNDSWEAVVSRSDLDAVVVSTTNDWLATVTVAALRSGKHVLCEKPLGRNYAEAQHMVMAASASGRVLKTGFNHRHHAAIAEAHELVGRGSLGELFFIRCRYGHGGRQGYEKEWRAQSRISGGGELLDQGVHVIDLFRWFLGDITEAVGFLGSYFWGANSESGSSVPNRIEDTAFALFRTAGGQIASLNASWVQWKNLFSFEIFGEKGYLTAEGLGGNYGPERLVWGKRRKELGPPDETCFDFPGPDRSWDLEWQEFSAAIREGRQPLASGEDGLAVMKLVDSLYKSCPPAALNGACTVR